LALHAHDAIFQFKELMMLARFTHMISAALLFTLLGICPASADVTVKVTGPGIDEEKEIIP
jgi:hypothetical protein